ncbi:uncharacterized protein L969DRAFT_18347 [Mixia osmundae IAM 14324]|uniref:CBS domain-containing protein n=1 Tax=Mixia osmundae (strain CBS 9802 / IAM 14324 / JCM 22182 / KY 12970) TaxID=764103 RepID=G7E0G3_MIXOS|nr:uncharacterized protein L969DRAFT_18347 [Mixia osmundae IAM 14324]KEI38332.1 hypothetical protein L969DRAFT_18347 [Mixia osmundae IAM 14324]GAA96323.1 hypothetical protein E5Q_02989 [Mixia osmundae IAM 14324]
MSASEPPLFGNPSDDISDSVPTTSATATDAAIESASPSADTTLSAAEDVGEDEMASLSIAQDMSQEESLAPAQVARPDYSQAHLEALESIRAFMRAHSTYDILPESCRLQVFDSKITVKRAVAALIATGTVSAPLYDSSTFNFGGMFTLTDVIHLIQYYYSKAGTYGLDISQVEDVNLAGLRDIETAIGVPPPPMISIHPDQSLFAACAAIVRTHARRIPLIDYDDQSGKDTILSVLTQYRVLKFIAINCASDTAKLCDSIGSLGVGTYISSYQPKASTSAPGLPPPPSRRPSGQSESAISGEEVSPTDERRGSAVSTSSSGSSAARRPSAMSVQPDSPFHPLAVATLETTVYDVVHMFSEAAISAVPVVDPQTGEVINLYETVDVIDLIRTGAYTNLDLTIGEALTRRSPDFPGVVVCSPDDSMASILKYIKDKRVHRMVIVDDSPMPARTRRSSAVASNTTSATASPLTTKHRLIGVLSLSDVLRHLVPPTGRNLQGLSLLRSDYRGAPPPPAFNLVDPLSPTSIAPPSATEHAELAPTDMPIQQT